MKNKGYLDIPFFIKEEDIQEDGSFKGYGSLFDKTPDSYGDLVAKGAFSKTLARGGRNRSGIPMLWQHRSDQVPGVWTNLGEDNKGLKSEGQLAINTELGKSIYEVMKLGAKHKTFQFGQSIGYDVINEEIVDKKKRIRTLKEVELWELSIVTFPAKLGANVESVKCVDELKTEREIENFLREVGSLSKKDAQYIVKLCKPSLREAERDVDEGVYSNLLDSLKTINNSFGVKKVIPFKSYSLANESEKWDASAQVKKASVEDLMKMCTWVDSENTDVKSAYKLPHHKADGFTTVWNGVKAAMGALLGARGGVDIPSGDKKGVYNHLAKHYKEFDKEVPELKEYTDMELKELFNGSTMDDILDRLKKLNA